MPTKDTKQERNFFQLAPSSKIAIFTEAFARRSGVTIRVFGVFRGQSVWYSFKENQKSGYKLYHNPDAFSLLSPLFLRFGPQIPNVSGSDGHYS